MDPEINVGIITENPRPCYALIANWASSTAPRPVAIIQNVWYSKSGGKEMAAKVKPVQPTEIKEKKIAREVIEQIRKPIPASVYKRNKEIASLIDRMTKR